MKEYAQKYRVIQQKINNGDLYALDARLKSEREGRQRGKEEGDNDAQQPQNIF